MGGLSAGIWARGAVCLALAVHPGASGAETRAAAANHADNGNCTLSPGESGTVAEVIDGDTLRLTDGRIVRLAGVEAPKSHLARAGSEVAVLSQSARQALERLVVRAPVVLHFGALRRDRHGRYLAQIRLADGIPLQEAMVAGGFVRVNPLGSELACLETLLRLEKEARMRRLGMWQKGEFAVIRANDPSLIERKGLYVLVEGRVVSVGRGNHVDFLNFGRYWRRDFTVLVGRSVAGRLEKGGVSVGSLAGKRVLVRGVIHESGGPAMRLSEPGEIEILE